MYNRSFKPSPGRSAFFSHIFTINLMLKPYKIFCCIVFCFVFFLLAVIKELNLQSVVRCNHYKP